MGWWVYLYKELDLSIKGKVEFYALWSSFAPRFVFHIISLSLVMVVSALIWDSTCAKLGMTQLHHSADLVFILYIYIKNSSLSCLAFLNNIGSVWEMFAWGFFVANLKLIVLFQTSSPAFSGWPTMRSTFCSETRFLVWLISNTNPGGGRGLTYHFWNQPSKLQENWPLP